MIDGTTIKVILMVMLLGGLVGATYVPETWEPLATFLARTVAVIWSAMALPERILQPNVLRRVLTSVNPVSATVKWHAA